MHVLIASDQALVATGIEQVLRSVAPAIRVSHAASIEGAMRCLREDPATAVVVLDLDMPGGARMHNAAALKSAWPRAAIVTLASDAREHECMRAQDIGCCAYLPKATDVESIRCALTRAVQARDVTAPALRRAKGT
jgi:DNA-binding NarL/FixJ family response regulator